MLGLVTLAVPADDGLGPDTLRGGYLLGCLLLAALLVLCHALIASRSGSGARVRAAAEELEAQAARLVEAARALEQDAVTNDRAAEELVGAAATGRSLAAGGLADGDLEREVERVREVTDEVQRKTQRVRHGAERRGEVAREVQEGATKVRDRLGGADRASFFGVLRAIAAEMPLVAAALLLVLLGGVGAGLIEFSVT